MVNTFEERPSVGDLHQLEQTRHYLQQLGHEVDFCHAPHDQFTAANTLAAQAR